MLTDYITAHTVMLPYMMYPKFLLTVPLSETSKLVYIMLLDRARLSIVNADYSDSQGRIFVYYPLDDIAADIDRSRTTVKKALTALEDNKLILRVHQGIGQASRIYVKIPHDYKGKNLTVPRTENSLAEDSFLSNQGQKIVHSEGRNMPGNKNDINKNNIIRMREQEGHAAYGSFLNVILSDEDYKKLHTDFSECDEYIERLSRYMASKGKTYPNHAATIRSWILQDRNKQQSKQQTRNYDCGEDESL